MIRNPLPIMEESGVSVACQDSLLVKRGWNINSNILAAITTSIMFSIPPPPFIASSLKRSATGGDHPGYRRGIVISVAPRTTVSVKTGAPSTLQVSELPSACGWYSEDVIAAASAPIKPLMTRKHSPRQANTGT
jgi:hypothetical protein